MDRKNQVLDALGDWIVQVTTKRGLATPEEIAALPQVAEVFFRNYSFVSRSSVKKENTCSTK